MEYEIPAEVRTLALAPDIVEAMRRELPTVATRTIAEVTASVSEYSDLPPKGMQRLSAGVQWALEGFLNVTAGSADSPDRSMSKMLDASYAQGRLEARVGRSTDAVLAAYRIGARVAWRDLAAIAIAHGLPPDTIAAMAELIFAHIDQLSAANVAGHNEELATTGRAREQYLQQLGLALLQGQAEPAIVERAALVDWQLPDSLTAVLLPPGQVSSVITAVSSHTLVVPGSLLQLDTPDDVVVMVVPDAARTRATLVRILQTSRATVGPARPWHEAQVSLGRAVLARETLPEATGTTIDTDDHLIDLIVAGDPALTEDLRDRALAPLAEVRPATRARLEETLRSWLLHQGRRDDVARDLNLHPQTIRYRMDQVKEFFGADLQDPDAVLALIIALARPGTDGRATPTGHGSR